MTEDSTVDITDGQKMLLLSKLVESEKGLGFLMGIIADPRARVQFRIEIEVTRVAVVKD